jgi:exo-beta-1,3-glucanase (GH17 family)
VAAVPVEASTEPEPFERRPFPPERGGEPLVDGISYGPFREAQRPGGPNPTVEQIREDLALLAPRFGMVRVYSSREPTETILAVLAETGLPLQVMVGAWVAHDDAEGNAAEVAEAIRLANAYPEQVLAVSVGNESQVAWSAHRSDRGALIEALRTVRGAIQQPVTTADDYNFWNKPEAQEVAAEVDFLCLHAYAMWNQQPLDDAVAWTATTYGSIRALHPDLPIAMCESGWATELNPEGDEVQYVKAPAGEAEQARFYAEYTTWARDEGVPYFYFEAFDEPWKGSEDPREIEKHWGLYEVDRTPKAVLTEGE